MAETDSSYNIAPATTSTLVSQEKFNGVRTLIAIYNIGSFDVYLSINQEAAANRGIYMKAGGGYYIEAYDGRTLPTQRRFTAIAIGGTGSLSVQERVSDNIGGN